MHLVTLEGLPRACIDIVRHIQGLKNIRMHTVPSPLPPAATSGQESTSDEITLVLENVLARLKILYRTQAGLVLQSDIIEPVAVCGAHWIESPPSLSSKARQSLHEISIEVGEATCNALGIKVASHSVIVLRVSVHECFENLLIGMEARDLNLSDLMEIEEFMDELGKESPASMFPKSKVHYIDCPPYMIDNAIDVAQTITEIASIIRTVA
jgi:hypothetical protein